MQTIQRSRQAIDLKAYRLRRAEESDYDTLVDGPFRLVDGDRLMAVYLELADDPVAEPHLEKLYEACTKVRYNRSARTNGLMTTSRTFGWLPKVPVRRDYCTSTSLSLTQPLEHQAVVGVARLIGEVYQRWNPELYAEHRQQAAEHMLPSYQLEDEPFTSGIINENNPLKYHFDRGNFVGVWSAMVGFKRGISGGYLSLPEYGIAAPIRDRSLFLFDGQDVLHGVTPIGKRYPDARRYTIVFYSMREMWNCQPVDDELLRIRRLRTERESKRLAR